jgi:hypothetical protein
VPDATPATVIVNVDIPGPVISRHVYGHFAEHLGRCIYGGFSVDEDSPSYHVFEMDKGHHDATEGQLTPPHSPAIVEAA